MRSGKDHDPILRAAQDGDPRAFSAIVAAHDAKLRFLAFRVLHDRDAMQDAMQEAYLAAYKGLPAFRGDCSLETWLHRITYTTCLRHLARRPAGLVPIEAVECECVAPDHAGSVAAERDLAAALAALPLDQRVAVVLVDRHGFSYRAAAKVLGVPPGTVASRLSYGRAALRAALGISHKEGGDK